MKKNKVFIVGSVLFFSSLLLGCGGESVEQSADIDGKVGEAVVDEAPAIRTKASKLVDAFTYNAFVNGLAKTSGFVITETHDITIGDMNLVIVAKHIQGWEDPGDFLKFELADKKTGEILIDEINIDGWVNFGDNYQVPDSLLVKNKLKSNKFLWLEINKKNYLFMVGWMYASSPGTMTVVDLDEKIICVNKKFKITGIEDHNQDGAMDLLGKVSITEDAVIDIQGENIINL